MINFIPENYQPAFGSLVVMLGIFGLIALVLHTFSPKTHNMALRKLREDEREANFVKTKPLPESMIKHIDISFLNLERLAKLSTDSNFISSINRMTSNLKYLDKKPYIIPDPSLSNLDIKNEYGPVSLQTYISYEQTYSNYCQKLLDIAQYLEKNNFLVESSFLLDELVNLKYDSSTPYIMLCDLYLLLGSKNDLLNLQGRLNKPDYFKNNDFGKTKILEKLENSLGQFN